MSSSKIGKDFTIKMMVTVKNPTKHQLVHFTNVLYKCKPNLLHNSISIDNVYKSDDFLQNLYGVRMLSIYDMSDNLLDTIKKPYPYKYPFS